MKRILVVFAPCREFAIQRRVLRPGILENNVIAIIINIKVWAL
jgi:hypothetical protein